MTSDNIARAEQAQLHATNPEQSVWVSASAGSGKTKVLTDRFLRLLLNGTRPQDVLCLTYTQAAAAEMIERLTHQLSQWAVIPEEQLVTAIGRLLFGASVSDVVAAEDQEARIATLLPRARSLLAVVLDCPGGLRLKTFHAFAQEILARFPLEAGLAPHFAVLDETEAQALQEQALADMLHLSRHHIDLAAAWTLLAGRLDMKRLQSLLRQSLHDRHRLQVVLQHYGDGNAACTALYHQAGLTLGQSAPDVLLAACADVALPLTALQDWQRQLLVEGKGKSAALLQFWQTATPSARVDSWVDYKKLFLTNDNEPRKNILSAATKKAQPHLVEPLQAEQERVTTVEHTLSRLERTEITAAALRLGIVLTTAYDACKSARVVLDYDDIINRAAALLAEPGIAPWVLWKLDGGLRHIMVDEAQDTSPQQWRIIQALTEEFFAGVGAVAARRTLFVVGDPKQSIYSFQHADPKMFQAMRKNFSDLARGAGQDLAVIDLDVSFRSAMIVLDTVNKIFTRTEAQDGVGASAAEHKVSRAAAKGRVLLHPLLTPTSDDTDVSQDWQPALEYPVVNDPLQKLAVQIATTIKDWIGCRAVCVREGGREIQRPCQPGDIMVLLRRRGALVPALIRALKQQGVPVAGVDRMVLRDALPVQDMLAVLQFVLLPDDDLNLACLLRGPFVGLNDDKLEQLCHGRVGSLWQVLSADAPCALIHAWLTDLLQRADQTGAYAFLAHLLHRPCPAAATGKMSLLRRLGLEALDPLDELLNRAQNFDVRHAPALQLFLQQMLQDDSQIKRPLEQGAGEVRVMTVHGSKGLQAPIVILPDCASVPRPQELPQLQWDEETGLPCYIGGKNPDARTLALYDKAVSAQRQEYRRLFYVALTRAECELHLYGQHGRKPQQLEESWHALAQQALAPNVAAAPGQPLFFVDEIGAMPLVLSPPVQASSQPLPDWISAPAPFEAPRRALHPSQLAADESVDMPVGADRAAALQRGRLMHQLLHYLPELPVVHRAAAALRFVQRQGGLDDMATQSLVREALSITEHPAYAPLFAPGSRGEVPLGGTVLLDGVWEELHGQLDRLALVGNEVWVVDFKTNRPPPQAAIVPIAYRQQLAAYRTLLQAVYPGKTVRSFLLWTQTAHIQELTAPFMPPLAQSA